MTGCVYMVALRKESVDRNFLGLSPWGAGGVALRKESVDRNLAVCGYFEEADGSLSARRAWIEIGTSSTGAIIGGGRSPQGERG